MKSFIRMSVGLAVAVAMIGCDSKTEPAGGEAGTPSPGVTAPGGETPSGGTAKLPGGLPDTKEVVETARKKAAEATEAAKETAEDVQETATEAAKEAQETATEAAKEAQETASQAMEDLANVAESTFSLEKLKSVLGSLSTENLTQVADKLMAALKDQQGIVKGLQDQIASLGIADALKAPELKKQLESALSVVDGLKAKLSSVVSTLKEKGLDVSKYTSVLGG